MPDVPGRESEVHARMPTYERLNRFVRDFEALSPDQQRQFLEARNTFVECLKAYESAGCRGRPLFPEKLGVKQMRGTSEPIMELSWGVGGRSTWEFGPPQQLGLVHVIWRRVGPDHDVYRDP